MACGCKTSNVISSAKVSSNVWYFSNSINDETLVLMSVIYNPTGGKLPRTVNGRVYRAGGSIDYILAYPQDVQALLNIRDSGRAVFELTVDKTWDWSCKCLQDVINE